MRPLRISLFCIGLAGLIAIGCGKEGNADDKTESAQIETTQADTSDGLAGRRIPIRNADNKLVTLETDFGNMTVELYRDVAPAHADSFVARSAEGFYDSLTFHRVIPNFMIQGGDPQGNGSGNAGYFINAEFNKLEHQEGTLSMARSGSPNSASCQFFICLGRQAVAHLDGQYTVFGHLIKGYDVLHAIEAVEKDKPGSSIPATPVYIKRAYVSDAEGSEL